ncbi:MAG: penicillin-binding protein 2 [Chloroflexi bacterium]|nr:penicillin-binding protein 2 [Chloroflexota bacterium]
MRYVLVLVLAFLLAGCSALEPLPPEPTSAPQAATEPPPTATSVPRRPEDAAANAFFADWQQGQYSAMYDLLSADAQAATTRDAFVRRYTNIHEGIGEQTVTAEATGPADSSGQIPFTVTRNLAIFGDVTEDNTLQVVQDASGEWKVAWQPGVIFSQLTASNLVRVTPDVPKRGRILDRSGKPLADNGSILSVGVVPGQIQDEGNLLQSMSDALGIPQDTIKQRYQGGQPDWFMPITDRSEDERDDLQSKIGSIPGVALQDQPARVYPLGSLAAHVVGYVTHPTADDLQKLASAGYDESDWIGRAGIEAWGEQQLAGTRGGLIQIVDSSGTVVREIARKAAVPGQDITLTLDSAIQTAAMNGLGDKTGSVVILDPRTNAVLALASQPSFDPNQFVIGLSDDQWQQMNGPDKPLVLRAAESGYPTGSIFKVITMAAGMEKGVAQTSDVYDCGLDWNGLPGVTLHNWQPEGKLKLSEALTESCNPAFYEIGLKLDQLDPMILPTYARTFGLGQSTDIVGISDSAGTVPDPTWKQQQIGEAWTAGDSVNLAIGQGYLLATPLQMANAYAALARGGSLLPPLLVNGQDTGAQPLGSLGLSDATQAAIQDGMKRVTSTPAGTAYYAFKDEKLPIAAKTGSAENENPDAHAWFVGYLPPDKPTLLVLVMVEGGQHGGTVAAPIARSLIDMAYPLSR